MNIIKRLRKEKKLTQSELAKLLNVHQTAVSQWEQERTTPDIETTKKLADFFGVTIDYLLGEETNVKPMDLGEMIQIPVYGRIPAGMPIEAIENIVDYITVPKNVIKVGDKYVALKVIGKSMYPKFIENDVVIIEVTTNCENGQDCAVYVNGYDVTLKKVIKQEHGILLQPVNPEYEAKFYPFDGEETVNIYGVVKQLIRYM